VAVWIAKTIEEARQHRRGMGGAVALVPTMGALHRGHECLIESAKAQGYQVVVSVFVNRIQFDRAEDYDRYPRGLEQDLGVCEGAGVAGVFCPEEGEMYRADQVGCEITVVGLADGLEGEHRPGHFAGVCRVVAKLLNIVGPQVCVFGEKDYQQLKVIEAMVADLAMPVRVCCVETVRDEDGVAVSSRNVGLSGEGRGHATGLFKALSSAKVLVEEDAEADPSVVEGAMRQVLEAHRVEVDYAVLRHAHTLGELDCIEPQLSGGVVGLVAGWVGPVRLIDNMVMGEAREEEGG